MTRNARADAIKAQIRDRLTQAVTDNAFNIVPGLKSSFGHEGGMKIEGWAKQALAQTRWNVSVFLPNEFLENTFSKLGKGEETIKTFLERTWWGFKFGKERLLVTEKQIQGFLSGEKIERWQQEAGDIVLFYGEDIVRDANDVVLLNIKSHDGTRASRPPNIMSAERLVKFFGHLLDRPDASTLLNAIEYWFVGIGYTPSSDKTVVTEFALKDLLLLDAAKIPQINFDAAIQIQWHVKDMVEKPTQERLLFIRELADELLNRWQKHASSKQTRYERLVKEIRSKVSGLSGS